MTSFDHELDARGLNCPIPILRTKKFLTTMETGAIVRIMATDPGSVKESGRTGARLQGAVT